MTHAQMAAAQARHDNQAPPEDDGEDGMAVLERDGFDLSEPDDGPDAYAADLACDRYERDIDARHA